MRDQLSLSKEWPELFFAVVLNVNHLSPTIQIIKFPVSTFRGNLSKEIRILNPEILVVVKWISYYAHKIIVTLKNLNKDLIMQTPRYFRRRLLNRPVSEARNLFHRGKRNAWWKRWQKCRTEFDNLGFSVACPIQPHSFNYGALRCRPYS